MNYRILPIVNMNELERALKEEYNEEFDLARLLYDYDDMPNEACKEYHFRSDAELHYIADILDEDEVRQLRLVNEYFVKLFPEYLSVMIYSEY